VKIIIWLWNPWLEYKKTRHNAGFLFLDYLKDIWWFEDFKDSKFKWLISEWVFNWKKIILLKPLTFMNLSGESIVSICNFYKIDFKKDIYVIFDDFSMEFGKVRFRDKWRDWWHNGIKSVIKNFWSEEFKRIKIWVGFNEKYDPADWTLSNFKKDELQLLENEIFKKAIKYIDI
jgi:peptidyl-tRNA hydrolase, PTH1 family